MAGVLTGLSRLSDRGSSPAKKIALDYMSLAAALGNKYIYTKYTGSSVNEYELVKTIADVTPYRYLYDDPKQKAKMTNGSSVYEFTAGVNKAYQGGESFDLASPPVLGGGFYLMEDDSSSCFDITAQYVNGSDRAVCVTEAVEELARQLLDALK